MDSYISQNNAFAMVENCVTGVRAWLIAIRLMIDDRKTEFLIIGTRHLLTKISIDSILVGDSVIKPLDSVRNLGNWFDCHMSLDDHVGKICNEAFRGLYNIRQIRKYLTPESTKTLVHALVALITVIHFSSVFPNSNLIVFRRF